MIDYSKFDANNHSDVQALALLEEVVCEFEYAKVAEGDSVKKTNEYHYISGGTDNTGYTNVLKDISEYELVVERGGNRYRLTFKTELLKN